MARQRVVTKGGLARARRGRPSIRCQVRGRVASGVRCAAKKIGDECELGARVMRTDRIHSGVHSGIEGRNRPDAIAARRDEDGAPVGLGACAPNPAAALQPIEDPGYRRGMQPGLLRERGWADGTVARNEIETIVIDLLEVDAQADLPIELRELVAQLSQRSLDRDREIPCAPGLFSPVGWFHAHGAGPLSCRAFVLQGLCLE